MYLVLKPILLDVSGQNLHLSTLVVGEMNHGQQSGEAKHEDDAALTEFLASLMDYTPTVNFPFYCLEPFQALQ